MGKHSSELSSLFSEIPRRFTPENVKEFYSLLDRYEDILRNIEEEPEYEKAVAVYFDDLDPIREIIKSSSHSKHSKQAKDKLFDEGADKLKDSIAELMKLYS